MEAIATPKPPLDNGHVATGGVVDEIVLKTNQLCAQKKFVPTVLIIVV